MKKDFESEFNRRQPNRPQIVRFMREALNKDVIEWSDLTRSNLMDIAEYFKERLAPNSARTYFAILSAFLNLYIEEGYIPCKKPADVLKCKKVPQQSIYLTEEEIKRIAEYYTKIGVGINKKKEKDVLTLFLIEAFCGARISDVKSFTMKNIRDGKLTYVSKKTKTLTEVPAHKMLPMLIQNIPTADYSATTIERTLRRVGRLCGITESVTLFYHGSSKTRPKCEFISSHVARKSFATNLARRGVSIYEISSYCGHSNTLQTDHYIIRDNVEMSAAAAGFFND